MPLDKMTKSIDSKSDFEDLNSRGDKMTKSIDSKSDFEDHNSRGNESTSGRGGSSGDTSPIELESYMKVLF